MVEKRRRDFTDNCMQREGIEGILGVGIVTNDVGLMIKGFSSFGSLFLFPYLSLYAFAYTVSLYHRAFGIFDAVRLTHRCFLCLERTSPLEGLNEKGFLAHAVAFPVRVTN